MTTIPLVGRLPAREWPYLVLSIVILLVEFGITLITNLLPNAVLGWFRRRASLLIRASKSDNSLDADPELRAHVDKLGRATGFVEICEIFGYDSEEHIVRTADGYLLGVHRIGGPKRSKWREQRTHSRHPRPVIYLHHGLLMNSEVWICNVDPGKSLAFVLADMGYDVWLGNNRGNKYSMKHVFRQPTERDFWNFCIDDFALYDIPDTVDYILEVAGVQDLTYIGFSQGSAQAFASLSINPQLNDKIKLFIALAPALSPPRLAGSSLVNTLVCASPSILYLFFGRKIILKSAAFWQSFMLPALYVILIDKSVYGLFRWTGQNIAYAQKLISYAHLYSYTSVKSVVHWFQIIRSGRFHMYDDDMTIFGADSLNYRVSPFPTRNILCPIVLLYGKTDSLVDIKCMLRELPSSTTAVGIAGHEHLDMIWGDDVDTCIFPYIFSALRRVRASSQAGLVNEFESRRPSTSWPSISHVANAVQNREEKSSDTTSEVHGPIG